MLKSYLTLALRTLTKQKLYAFINIFGLAVGLACAVLILLYVQHELSYDQFHEKGDRTYHVVQRQPGNVFLGSDRFAVTPAVLAATLLEDYPEVEQATTVSNRRKLLSVGDQHFHENGIVADAAFFDVFTFPLLQGDPATALAEPNRIVLTESLAKKLFGETDPMGRTLTVQRQDTYTITGITRDAPENGHLAFEFVASILSESNYRQDLENQRFNNNSWHTYFVLQEGADVEQLEAKMPAFVQKYVTDEDDDDPPNEYYFEALPAIHLFSDAQFQMNAGSDIKYVYLFSAIAVVILLLACVNYTNLAVARSIKRAREVGLRKVVGAGRGQLIRQFLGESVLMALVATGLALVLAHLLLPLFGTLVERPLRMDYASNPLLAPGLLALVLLVGVVAGSYPALFMSGLNPSAVLKGTGETRSTRSWLQRALVVSQYAVSIALVAGSLIIYQQLQYVQNKEIGYNRDHVVTVRLLDPALREQYQTIRSELLRNPNVASVTSAGHLPTNIGSSTTIQGWEGSDEEDELRIYQANTDYDFLDVFDIPLVAGRNFSRDIASDSVNTYLINETAARGMGWTPEEAVGKTFERSQEAQTIVGVVKDFHMHSLHQPIEPLMIQLNTSWMGYIAAKVRPDDLPKTVAFLEETVQSFTPYPVDYEFLDDTFNQMYQAEMRLGETFGYFTALALLIASLGLFGLAAFAAEQRTKEIGVRKVLGASVPGLLLLLSKEFTRLVVVAAVLALPLAYLAMNRWLEDFAYRVDISWPIFLVAGLAALAVALVSVSYQALQAARVNPVDSLRYE